MGAAGLVREVMAKAVTVTLIVSFALVLCVWLVLYLSPYQTCVHLTILDGYDLDEAGLHCALEMGRK